MIYTGSCIIGLMTLLQTSFLKVSCQYYQCFHGHEDIADWIKEQMMTCPVVWAGVCMDMIVGGLPPAFMVMQPYRISPPPGVPACRKRLTNGTQLCPETVKTTDYPDP